MAWRLTPKNKRGSRFWLIYDPEWQSKESVEVEDALTGTKRMMKLETIRRSYIVSNRKVAVLPNTSKEE